MTYFVLVAGMLFTSAPAHADGGCMPTYAFRCPCRPDCDQSYCEKYCSLCGETGTQCRYCCNPYCACGAVGKNTPKSIFDLTAGLLAQNASAAEIKSAESPKEYTNAHGDFLIVPKFNKATPAAGIGVRVVKTGKLLRIDEVFKGGPAEMAGLTVGDLLLSISGRKSESLDLRAAATALRGKAGSRVKLVIRKTDGKVVTKTLVRSDYKAVETASKQSVAFKTVPPVEGVCAPKYEDCLHLYADAEGCHYTCKTVTK